MRFYSRRILDSSVPEFILSYAEGLLRNDRAGFEIVTQWFRADYNWRLWRINPESISVCLGCGSVGSSFPIPLDITRCRSKLGAANHHGIGLGGLPRSNQGINTRDRAIQESMGPIVERSKEFLGSSDMAIITARRMLNQAVNRVRDGGDLPGVKLTYNHLRAAEQVIPYEGDWQGALMSQLYPVGSAAKTQ